MFEIIHHLSKYFTDISYNVWPWIFLLVIPILIFSARPEHQPNWRLVRIIMAIGIGYILINLALHTDNALDWKAYEECRSQSKQRIDSFEMMKECGHQINIADGASIAFYLFLGWIPAAAYAGLYEFWWRLKYRYTIREMGSAFTGKWFSSTLIISSIPVWAYLIILASLVVYMRAVCPEPTVASDKCWFPR